MKKTSLFLLFLMFCPGEVSAHERMTNDSLKTILLIESKKEQTVRLDMKRKNTYHVLRMDREEFPENEIASYDKDYGAFIIQKSGYYDLSASIHFSPNTNQLVWTRAGINFVFCRNKTDRYHILAEKRQSFYKENSEIYTLIDVAPTIVFLEKGDRIMLCVQTGLLGTDLLNTKVGSFSGKTPYSFRIQIKDLEIYERQRQN